MENKNSAPQARFRSQTPSKQAKVHAFWLPKQQCNQPQPPQPPHWSTRPTGPVDHPADPPTHRAPHPHPTLALGLRTLGAPGPPPGPCFPVFVFSRPPASSDPPGLALTERSKTLRPGSSRCSSPQQPLATRMCSPRAFRSSASDMPSSARRRGRCASGMASTAALPRTPDTNEHGQRLSSAEALTVLLLHVERGWAPQAAHSSRRDGISSWSRTGTREAWHSFAAHGTATHRSLRRYCDGDGAQS